MKVDGFQWRSLKARVTLTTLAILLIGIGSLAFYTSKTMREDMDHLLGDQQQATVRLVAAAINSDFHDRIEALHGVALGTDAQLVSDPKALQTWLEQRSLLQVFFNAGIFVTRIDGVAVAEFPLIGRVGLNYMDRDHVAAALTEGKTTVGKPTIGKRVRAASFAITVPIRDSAGKVIGAISGATDLSKPNFLGDIDQSRYGQTGGYLIVDPKSKQFVVATANNRKLVMQPLPAIGVNTVFDRRLDGFDGTAVNVSSQGVEVLTSSARIPEAGWFVIATLPTEEAFAPIRNMLQRTVLVSILLSLLASTMAWWALKRQLKPALETIQTLKVLSESGGHPQPLAINTNDEIGDLIGAFNRLLSTLADRENALKWSEEGLRSMFSTMVEGVVFQRKDGTIMDANVAAEGILMMSRDELLGKTSTDPGWHAIREDGSDFPGHEHPSMVTLRTGKPVREEVMGLALSNGKTRWISINSQPVLMPGQLLPEAVVTSFNDITNRRMIEEELAANRAEVQLGVSRQRLRDLVVQNEKTRELDRKEVAREVHDELGQAMAALRMNFMLMEMRYCANDPGLSNLVRDMKATLDRGIKVVRDVVAHLRPVALNLGLIAAIESLCAECSIPEHLEFVFSPSHQEEVELDEARLILVFRIVQESVTNILRHAQASRVEIDLNMNSDLCVQIRDNGVGFNVSQGRQKNSFGLLGMQERAIALGGSLEIESTPMQGTTVRLVVPLGLELMKVIQ